MPFMGYVSSNILVDDFTYLLIFSGLKHAVNLLGN